MTKHFMQPEGLIFDCDGTVVDTMPIHYAAWCSTTAKHGLEFPEDRFYALGGVSPFEVLRMLSEEQGVEIDAEAVTFQKEARYMELIADAEEIPEVMQIVREQHGKLPMAIASGAAGVGVGSAVNRLNDELAMTAVVRGLREALGRPVISRV